jgi:hypothetical protein
MNYIKLRDETTGACSTHKGEGECLLGLVGKPPPPIKKDLEVDGEIKLK